MAVLRIFRSLEETYKYHFSTRLQLQISYPLRPEESPIYTYTTPQHLSMNGTSSIFRAGYHTVLSSTAQVVDESESADIV